MGGLCTAALLALFAMRSRDSLRGLEAGERWVLERQASEIGAELQEAADDVRLAAGLVAQELRTTPDDPEFRRRCGARLQLLMSTHSNYDQLRVLDLRGQEQVRVNRSPSGPVLVPNDELQDKSDRYYFLDAAFADRDTVYVSRIDLNVEHSRIARPLEPVLRFGMPLFDAEGKRQGAVLLNYRIGVLLESALQTAPLPGGEVSLVNEDGYWLHAPDPGDAWGHLLAERAGSSFAQRESQAWAELRQRSQGQVVSDRGLFTSVRLPALHGRVTGTGRDAKWTLVSHFPRAALARATETPERDRNAVAVIVALLVLVVSFLSAQSHLREQEQKRLLRRAARYDALTGLANRSVLLERLREALQGSVDREGSVALLMVDLDGFKEINDTRGHASGDALLRHVARRLRSLVRTGDTVARLGGDEFVVLLPRMQRRQAAIEVARKCLSALRAPHYLGPNRERFEVGASIGIALFPGDGRDAEELLGAADAAMYAAKTAGKNTVRLFTSPRPLVPGEYLAESELAPAPGRGQRSSIRQRSA